MLSKCNENSKPLNAYFSPPPIHHLQPLPKGSTNNMTTEIVYLGYLTLHPSLFERKTGS